jgi:prephenate dehydrogenase
MPVQVTIIGLGQIGGSVGLALADHKETILRVGHDKKTNVEGEAVKRGAVDRAEHNLPAAVRDARVVVLCLPVSQVRATLELIAPDLKENTIVLDTAPVKSEVAKWVKEYLPADRYYVGLVPSINPEALHDLRIGLEAARPDLFMKGTFLIGALENVPEEAVLLVLDFVRLLGAQPLFADMAESDGMMASVHVLPQLIASALLTATLDQPGWQEARKMAGRAYAIGTSAVAYQDEIDSLRMLSLQNRLSVVHVLDVMMASLRGLRDDIEKGDEEGIAERLESALEGRQRWMHERMSANWLEPPSSGTVDIPSFTERLFGGAFTKKQKHK